MGRDRNEQAEMDAQLSSQQLVSERMFIFYEGATQFLAHQIHVTRTTSSCAVCCAALLDSRACMERLDARRMETLRAGLNACGGSHPRKMGMASSCGQGEGFGSTSSSKIRPTFTKRAGALLELRTQKMLVLAQGKCLGCLSPLSGDELDSFLSSTDLRASEMERTLHVTI